MVDFPHKIVVPQRSPRTLSRSRLNAYLSTIVERRLITVSSPPGYGKTSLLIDFASNAQLPVCWYTLDHVDRDPWVFVEYLVAAITQNFPGALQQTRALLSGEGRTALATVTAALTRDIYAIAGEFAIILDDWHLVEHVNDISELMANLLLRCPNCHLIIASRNYPRLPNTMLLTARRQMSSIDEREIRFTPEEARDVLLAEYDIALSTEDATVLAELLNGWITGILLSFHTAHQTPSVVSLCNAPVGRHIYRFMVEQVFDQQPEDIRRFLLDTAVLEDFTPQCCDQLFQRSDSRQMFETLLRRHLFVAEIRPGVLRYHPMFREFLLEHFNTIDRPRYDQVSLQVAELFAAQGQWLQAFEQYIAAGRPDLAQRVVAAGGEQMYAKGRIETLNYWFSVIPDEQLSVPLLCLKARVALDNGNHQEAQMLANMASLNPQPEYASAVLLLQAQLARIEGNYQRAMSIAESVLDAAQESAQVVNALRILGICNHRVGRIECAINKLKDACDLARAAGDLHTLAKLQHDIGLCYKDMGDIHAARDFYGQADAYWASTGNAGQRVLTLNSLGIVEHLSGAYPQALATLNSALQCAQKAHMPDYEAMVQSSIGDMYCDLQLWEQATSAYDTAQQLGGNAYIRGYLELERIRLLVRQRQFEEAGRALRKVPEPAAQRHKHVMGWLQSCIACGLGHSDEARQHVEQLVARLEQSHARMELARACMVQAQVAAESAPADAAAILAPLDRAVQLAQQLGHESFLIVETLHFRAALHRAAALDWPHATRWMQLRHDLQITAQAFGQSDDRPMLVVRTMGVDQIVLNRQPVEIGWNKAREVFYYLLAHPDGASAEALCEAIWPDTRGGKSRETLRTAIYQLRSALPRELIESPGRQIYRVNRTVLQVNYDVERFEQLIDDGENDPEMLFEALNLYRGSYLTFADSNWCAALRSRLDQRYTRALHLTAESYIGKQLFADALALYQRILATDELDEAAHAGVMRCQIGLGNRAAAINQYQKLRRILDEEYGLDPGESSEVELLYRHILTT